MALLIVDLDKHIGNARTWRDTFGEQLPDLEIRISPDAGNLADIEYLAFMHPDFDFLPVFPNLKAMFSALPGSSPFTRETKGIFCARTFAMMPRGAMPVNVGRGKHVVDEDLIKALDSGRCHTPR